MKAVEADSKIGKDTVAWCCDANTGETIWTREIPGIYQAPLSGKIVSFDFDGGEIWSVDAFCVARAAGDRHWFADLSSSTMFL